MLKVLVENIKKERCPLMRISRCRAIWSSECHFVQLLIYSRHASYCCYYCCCCHIYQVKTTRVGNSSGTGAIRLIGSLDSHECSDEVTKRLWNIQLEIVFCGVQKKTLKWLSFFSIKFCSYKLMQPYTFFHKPLSMPRIYINSIIIWSTIASC